MLGIIFEVTNTIFYNENILLGHLFKFKNLNRIELDLLKEEGEKIFRDLNEYDRDIVSHLSTEERKARNHKLISIGALLEITEITDKNLAILMGFINLIHSKDKYYLNQCELDGKLYFLKKGGNKHGRKRI